MFWLKAALLVLASWALLGLLAALVYWLAFVVGVPLLVIIVFALVMFAVGVGVMFS